MREDREPRGRFLDRLCARVRRAPGARAALTREQHVEALGRALAFGQRRDQGEP